MNNLESKTQVKERAAGAAVERGPTPTRSSLGPTGHACDLTADWASLLRVVRTDTADILADLLYE